jgi:hypothetical protein
LEWLSSKTPPPTNVGEDAGKKESSYTACGNVSKLVQPLWKTIWRLLKKLNIDLPYDPAIPLLGIYLRNATQVITKVLVHPCLLQHYL